LSSNETIAVVGAGFSGTMLAVHLLRRTQARVLLIESGEAFGPGLAHGTRYDIHLLNVRSRRMSAFPDAPEHFAQWLSDHHPEVSEPDGFAPRKLYGEYLISILDEADRAAPGRLQRVRGEVTRIDPAAGSLALTDGRAFTADRLVLALGNPPPGVTGLDGFKSTPPDRYLNNPWAAETLARVGENDELLLVGTGLTMVDTVLALRAQGWRGHALALSRRGLLPRAHDDKHPHVDAWPAPDGSLSQKMKAVRARAREVGAGPAIDEIRPFNQAQWRGMDRREQARFLRHLRPWWDVHRHRTAPAISAQIDKLEHDGFLDIAAGRIVSAFPQDDGLHVEWRRRGERETRQVRVDRAINCTGPLLDLTRANDPLTRQLLNDGVARADDLRLGFDVDANYRVIDARGRAHANLYAAGAITRAECWEIVAVPEIRSQVAMLAARFAEATVTA
jgi:uncharacterized NAD(P)/FAD-binding protein YdhS